MRKILIFFLILCSTIGYTENSATIQATATVIDISQTISIDSTMIDTLRIYTNVDTVSTDIITTYVVDN
jgi:hypothetical protein